MPDFPFSHVTDLQSLRKVPVIGFFPRKHLPVTTIETLEKYSRLTIKTPERINFEPNSHLFLVFLSGKCVLPS